MTSIASIANAPDGKTLAVNSGAVILRLADGKERRNLGPQGSVSKWMPDSRRLLLPDISIRTYDVADNRWLGVLVPHLEGGEYGCIGPEGHYRGSAKFEEHIVFVAQHDDGSQRTYTPAEFAAKFGWKNDPSKARLLSLDP